MSIINRIPEFGVRRKNEEWRNGGCAVVFDPKTQKYAVGRHYEDGLLRLFSGGVDPGEDMEAGTLREVVEESGLNDFLYVERIDRAIAHYFNILRNVNRVADVTCFLVVLKSARLVDVKLEAHEKFVLDWVTADEIFSNWEARNESSDYNHWIYFFKKAVQRVKELGYDKDKA